MRLINADTLKEQIPETSVDIFENCRNCSLLDKDQVLEIIDAAPTIDAEPIRHGHWVHECNDNVCHLSYFYHCSVCNAEWNCIDNEMERFDYCPSCGAKMDEGDT